MPVGDVAIHDKQIIVQLGQDHTCCKAKDRAVTEEEKAVACCAPAVTETTQPKVDLSGIFADSRDVCTPGGGCC